MATIVFPKLFEPGYIGNLEIKNRIVMAPMGTGYEDVNGSINERQINYLSARARGGTGLIITGLIKVYRKVEYPPITGFWMDADMYIDPAAHLVQSVHEYGAKICAQLTAGVGRQQRKSSVKRIPFAPSTIPAYMNPDLQCREITEEQIKELIQAHRDAARRIVTAGFDMIEFHGHAGYLTDQFMSSLWNKRNDAYGGDFEKRLIFPMELIAGVRDTVGSDFPLSFRLSADHKIHGGRRLNEALEIAKRLERSGIDVLHVDAGCYESMPWIFPPNYYSEGCLVDLADAVKQVVTIPVIAVGRIARPEFAEQILETGKADFIAMGRQLIADPEWANKAREGRIEDICPCIYCNELCVSRELNCSVNPVVGKESYYPLKRAAKQKRIMVIGGGPSGMEAARVAALRGHDVALYEKENALGGQLRLASEPVFKYELLKLLNYLSNQVYKAGVKVKLGKEVTVQTVTDINPDAVIVATGAIPLACNIHGIEHVIQICDLHHSKVETGDNVIVAGGGLTGCDTALSLAQTGKNVIVIDMLPAIATDLNSISRQALLQKLEENRVTILTGHKIKKFTAKGLIATDRKGKERAFQADSVIFALGNQSRGDIINVLRERYSEVYCIGDCVNPRKIGDSIGEGFMAGWKC